MTCPNCARLMNRCAVLMNKMAMLQKAYAAKPDKKTVALAVLECGKLKNENKKLSEKCGKLENENKKLSEKVRNISSKCMEIKKTLKQREAYIKALSRRLEKNALKKEVDNYILMYNALNEKYQHQAKRIEEYEDMEAVWRDYEQADERWRKYCNLLRTENENIKKQLEDREAENEQLSRMLQKYQTKERDFASKNKGFNANDVWKMNDAEKNREGDRSLSVSSELSSLSGRESLSDTDLLFNRMDDGKNPFIINDTRLDENNIVNHHDIQDINNNGNNLSVIDSSRSDIYKNDDSFSS